MCEALSLTPPLKREREREKREREREREEDSLYDVGIPTLGIHLKELKTGS